MVLMNKEEALAYICEHQFDLDPTMRSAVFSIVSDNEKMRRESFQQIEWLEEKVFELEMIKDRVVGMRERLAK